MVFFYRHEADKDGRCSGGQTYEISVGLLEVHLFVVRTAAAKATLRNETCCRSQDTVQRTELCSVLLRFGWGGGCIRPAGRHSSLVR